MRRLIHFTYHPMVSQNYRPSNFAEFLNTMTRSFGEAQILTGQVLESVNAKRPTGSDYPPEVLARSVGELQAGMPCEHLTIVGYHLPNGPDDCEEQGVCGDCNMIVT